MATALISALTGRYVSKEVAMTGEITLRGRVLPIGGLKEKSLAAHRAGIKKVLMPKENERDLREIPDSVKAMIMEFVPVSHMDEVLQHALLPKQCKLSDALESRYDINMKITQVEFVISAVRPHQYPEDALPEIALAGRSNVGKSSLINQMIHAQGLGANELAARQDAAAQLLSCERTSVSGRFSRLWLCESVQSAARSSSAK